MNARIGRTGLPAAYVATLWLLAVAGAVVAWGVRIVLPPIHPALAAAAILGPYGLLYMAGAFLRGIPEAVALVNRVARRR